MRIAVVGATGALGREIVAVLSEESAAAEWGGLDVPVLFASKESTGEVFPWGDAEDLEIEALTADALRGVDLAVLATPEATSLETVSMMRSLGIAIVDASRAHRKQSSPWLSGPVGPGSSVLNLPSAEGLMVARTLAALSSLTPKWVRATVIKAASGAGEAGVSDLAESSAKLLNGMEPETPRLMHRLAFNLVPQAGAFTGRETEDELNFAAELPALTGQALAVASTFAYGPWFYGHFADVTVGFAGPVDASSAGELFRGASGVKLVDDPEEAVYPMPSLATGDENALVGRVRADPIDSNALRFIVVCDNVRSSAVHAVTALKAAAKLRRAH